MIIGVVGKAGSGKTLISRYLGEIGYELLTMDNIAKDLYKKPTASTRGEINVYVAVAEAFGAEKVLDYQGEIDKAKLGKIVFNSHKAMKRLNRIMLPAIEEQVRYDIKHLANNNVVLDGALLLNSTLKDYCDVILYVDAPRKVRIARLINRGVSKSVAIKMSEAVNIKKQDILKSKKPVIIINNDGSTNELMTQISNIVKIGIQAKIKS